MMGVWDPKDKITALSQIKKAVGARYQGLKGWGGMILPGILIGFYFFIFFLLLSGCSYFKKEKVREVDPLTVPPIEFICKKIDCGDEDIKQLIEEEQNTIACIKLQPECKLDEEN